LLRDFQYFFVLSEGGCRYFRGALADLESELEREQATREAAYARNLQRMVEAAEHTEIVARRRARKERYGRVREMDRGSPRLILNLKRNQAQVNHGKEKAAREARLDRVRQFAKASRRALQVEFPLLLPVGGDPGKHPRLAVIGPNGAGKTTLLRSMLEASPRAGSIAQGASDWMLEESLLTCLGYTDAAERLVAHKFPLALAQRPLRSLSPGERVRAALICLFQRAPETLILDEPTYSLDLLGKKALTAALKAWPGGLAVASHDMEFLREIGVEEWIELEGFLSRGHEPPGSLDNFKEL
jgi:ATPase subunit of ABC transporter with duplicated ATPase domains